MLKLSSMLMALLFLSACGKKEPTPPPAPTSPPPAITPADAAATPADAAAAVDTDRSDRSAYLVWLPTGEGYETTWIAPDDAGGIKVVGRRAQATLFAGGALWGVETRWLPLREVPCEDFDRQEEGGPAARPGPKKHVPWLAARALAGDKAGTDLTLTSKVPSQLFGEPEKDGAITMIGEHWGRTVQLAGGAADVLLVTDCDGAYQCGAHGDHGCGFGARDFAGKDVTIDLGAARNTLAPDTKAMIADWVKESEGEVNEPDIRAVYLIGNGGEPRAAYVYVADVAYAATSGDWGSYTQSRNHLGKVLPELGLAETPALVKAFLADKPRESTFGWSAVPADAAAGILEAFRDDATLPAPRPADESAEQVADADAARARVNEGRKLTRDKQYVEAIAAFDEALKLSGDKLARAWSGRGYARLLAGDLAGAESDFQKALTLDDTPKFQAAIYFNLGELAEGQKDKAKAIGFYEKANTLSPSDAAKKRLEKLKVP